MPQPKMLSPPEALMELALLPLRIGGAISQGMNNVAQGRGQKDGYREHSTWGYYKATMSTDELDDMQIFG